MSGIVTVISGRGAELGPRALDLVRHDDAWPSAHVVAGESWTGVTGRSGSWDAAQAGDEVCVAVCGRVTNLAESSLVLGIPHAGPAHTFLAAYGRWGLRGLEQFAGAFAFTLTDAGRRLVVAGADPSGVFRQHAVRLGSDVLLGTEAKAFMAHPRFRAALDPLAAAESLRLGYVLDGRSLFQDVLATPHGAWIEVRDGEPRVVRRWDMRAELGRGRWGAPYRRLLAETARGVAADAFGARREELGDGLPLLPLTGGLDSRLLAAAAPPGTAARAVTFGVRREPDVVLGERIARARGWQHRLEPLEHDYVRRHAAATVWVSEGRLNPVGNLTGFLMPRVAGHDGFVSGVGGEVGRHQWKAHALWPDWPLLEAGDAGFEQCVRAYLYESSLDGEGTRALLSQGLRPALDAAEEDLDRVLAHTRGLEPVDRVDLFIAMHRIREVTQPGLLVSELTLDVLAPFLTRRWLGAVLSGAPAQRHDDTVRLRLIRALDPGVAAVPWALTRLPLLPSAALVAGLHAASLATWRLGGGRRGAAPAPGGGPAVAGRSASGPVLQAIRAGKKRIYSHGERRDEWLRHHAADFVRQTLLAPPQSEPVTERAAVERLLRAHLAGADHSLVLGQLLGLRLWQRLFLEQDEELRGEVRSLLGCAGDAGPQPAVRVA